MRIRMDTSLDYDKANNMSIEISTLEWDMQQIRDKDVRKVKEGRLKALREELIRLRTENCATISQDICRRYKNGKKRKRKKIIKVS